MIKINNKTISKIYKGETPINKIYKGNILIWQSYKQLIEQGVPPIHLTKCLNENLVNYKIYGNSFQSDLPDGYTQLEYIESTGTQYIDTGISATVNTGIYVKYCYTDNGSAAIAGIFQNTAPRTDTLFITSYSGNTNSTIWMAHRGYTSANTLLTIVLNQIYNTKINYLNDGAVYLDETNVGTVGNNNIESSNILLFARLKTSDNSIAISNSRIYYAEFTEGNVISHKFIPAKNSNNVVGLYDLVTNMFYTNTGTDDFTAGPAATIPNPDVPMEIQSVGEKTINLFDITQLPSSNNAETCLRNGDTIVSKGYAIGLALTPTKFLEMTGLQEGDYFWCINKFTLVKGTKGSASGRISFGAKSNSDASTLILNGGVRRQIPIGFTSNYNNTLFFYGPATNNNSEIEAIFSDIAIIKTESETKPDYEPYGYKIPVTVSGNQLFSASAIVSGNNNIGFNITTANYVNSSSGQTVNVSLLAWKGIATPMINKAEFDFVSIKTDRSSLNNDYREYEIILQGYDSAGNKTSSDTRVSSPVANTLYTITKESIWDLNTYKNSAKFRICILSRANAVNNMNVEFYGNSLEPYHTPATTNIYIGNEPLRKIGNYTNHIDFESQKVYRNIKTFELGKTTPVNDWSSAIGSNGYDRFITSFSNLGITDVGLSGYGFSTHFIPSDSIPGNNETSAKFYLSTDNSNIYLTFPESLLSGDLSTASGRSLAFNNYLSQQYNNGTGVKIIYPMANEVEKIIALPDILLNKGTNIINVDTEIIPNNMEIEYKSF